MTTTTYYVGAEISKDAVYEGIYSYTASSDISEGDMHALLRKITSEVNKKNSRKILPGNRRHLISYATSLQSMSSIWSG